MNNKIQFFIHFLSTDTKIYKSIKVVLVLTDLCEFIYSYIYIKY